MAVTPEKGLQGATSDAEVVAGAFPDPLLKVTRFVGVSNCTRKVEGLPHAVPRRYAAFMQQLKPTAAAAAAAGAADPSLSMPTELSWCAAYSSSMTLALVNLETKAEECTFGHSQPVELLEVSDDGLWAASVQGAEGGTPTLVRLWHVEPSNELKCVSVLSCPVLASVRAVAFDVPAKNFAVAGLNHQGRQLLLTWDISKARTGGNISLLARQMAADWDIDVVKFSPFEAMRLVSCGKENIRFWRVKEGHLPGCSVVLNSLARQTHFTCIAFEYNKMTQPHFLGESLAKQHRCYVGTATGKLLQLSYNDRTVQAVFDLHNEAILDLCANESFVVTGSADKYVRVWPLDFNSFYLHAMHDAPITGVDMTVDGTKILCSTSDGTIGVLNLQNHQYTDLVHSHKARIIDAAASHHFQEVATISSDGALKVWSLPSMSQTYEFSIADDAQTCLTFHPGDRHIIATGSQSGTLRIFDVEGLTMMHERRNHTQPIRSLAAVIVAADDGPIMTLPFCPDHLLRPLPSPHLRAAPKGAPPGSVSCQIVLCDASGGLSFHSESRDFEMVRSPEQVVSLSPPEGCPAMVCVPPRLLKYLDPHTLALFSFPDLAMRRSLRACAAAISTFSLSPDAKYIVIGTVDSKVQILDAATGLHVHTTALAHGPIQIAALTTFDLAPPYHGVAVLVTAASDGVLRAIELKKADDAVTTDPLGEQTFIGHATTPHRILFTSSTLISVSASEALAWSTSGGYFAALCAMLASSARPAATTRSEGDRGEVDDEEAEATAAATAQALTSARVLAAFATPRSIEQAEPPVAATSPVLGSEVAAASPASAEVTEAGGTASTGAVVAKSPAEAAAGSSRSIFREEQSSAREASSLEQSDAGMLLAQQAEEAEEEEAATEHVVEELRKLAEADDMDRLEGKITSPSHAKEAAPAEQDAQISLEACYAAESSQAPTSSEVAAAHARACGSSSSGMLAQSMNGTIIVEHMSPSKQESEDVPPLQMPHAQPLCQIRAATLCTSLAFLSPSILLGAFYDGSMCVFNLAQYALEAKVTVSPDDPIMAMRCLSASSVLIGTAEGQLYMVRLGTGAKDSSGLRAQKAALAPMDQSKSAGAVCSIASDNSSIPMICVACFSTLQLRVLDCTLAGTPPRHTWTWVWPESLPQRTSVSRSRWSDEACSDLLSKPPLVASVLVVDGNPVVLVTAPPCQCLYIYCCTTGAILNRVSFADEMRLVTGIWSGALTATAVGSSAGTALLLCHDRVFVLRVLDGGARAVWSEKAECEDDVRAGVGVATAHCITRKVPGCGVLTARDAPFSCWAVAF
mmetsp:Transcript_7175/g.15656  ORF Transcript_7175/g.15656 Transcript_7175/m.15656 type:complete len:1314 (+) Transcript_7175:96-4037(+)